MSDWLLSKFERQGILDVTTLNGATLDWFSLRIAKAQAKKMVEWLEDSGGVLYGRAPLKLKYFSILATDWQALKEEVKGE